MPFTKEFFDRFSETYKKYLNIYPSKRISVAIRSLGQDYLVGMIISHDEFTLTFSYYDEKKQVDLNKNAVMPQALPAPTLPYEFIESIEFNPAAPDTREYKVGFGKPKNSEDD